MGISPAEQSEAQGPVAEWSCLASPACRPWNLPHHVMIEMNTIQLHQHIYNTIHQHPASTTPHTSSNPHLQHHTSTPHINTTPHQQQHTFTTPHIFTTHLQHHTTQVRHTTTTHNYINTMHLHHTTDTTTSTSHSTGTQIAMQTNKHSCHFTWESTRESWETTSGSRLLTPVSYTHLTLPTT